MATNLYFNNFGASQEQLLIENLIIESIKIYGIDTYYIPRTPINLDETFDEAAYNKFNQAILVEMYIKNVDGFQGDGEFLSKFGIEVRDQITFTIAQRVFSEEVEPYTSQIRPSEGDLIFFPLTSAVYQIKFVNVRAVFYQLGALQMYDIVCELYEASSDVFDTGITEIDQKYNAFSLTPDNYFITTESGNILITEAGEQLTNESYNLSEIDPLAQNEEFEQLGKEFIDFTEFDPFSEGDRGDRI